MISRLAQPAVEMPLAELTQFVERTKSAQATSEILDLMEALLGVDVLEYLNRESAAAWAGSAVGYFALALMEGDVDFPRDFAKSIKYHAKAQGVRIARGKEKLVADRFDLITRTLLRMLPILL